MAPACVAISEWLKNSVFCQAASGTKMYRHFHWLASTENAMDGNKAKVPPIVQIFTDEDKKKIAGLDKQIAALNNDLKPWGQNSKLYKDWLSVAEAGKLELKKPEKPYLHLRFEEIKSLEIPMEGTAAPTAQLKSKELNVSKHITNGKSGQALRLDGKDFVESLCIVVRAAGNLPVVGRDESVRFAVPHLYHPADRRIFNAQCIHRTLPAHLFRYGIHHLHDPCRY